MAEKTYHVRQYRPGYFTGFDNSVVYNLPEDKITDTPWSENFKHGDFEKFTVGRYGRELIVEAYYKSGAHWVVGFAVESTDPLAEDWRYKPHTS